ncbi:hypothetical protein ACFLXC_04865 [Chloroflexota bacterium]
MIRANLVYLRPNFIISEVERLKNEPNQLDSIEEELTDVLKRLLELDREQERLLQWALKGFPDKTVINENDKINRTRLDLQKRKAQLEKNIEDTKRNEFDLEGIEKFCRLASENLEHFSYEDKRLALEALKIKVVIDGDKITVHGAIPIIQSDIVSTLACWKR